MTDHELIAQWLDLAKPKLERIRKDYPVFTEQQLFPTGYRVEYEGLVIDYLINKLMNIDYETFETVLPILQLMADHIAWQHEELCIPGPPEQEEPTKH